MDEFQNVEQPSNDSLALVENDKVNQPLDFEVSVAGSTLGKFKDATSLLSAYDSLQAEFTRKSQKLSEAQKKLAELMEKNNSLAQDDTGLLAKGNVGAVTENKDTCSADSIEIEKLKAQNLKLEKSQNWKRKVDSFFDSTSDAKTYALEMAKILKDNKGLRDLDNALTIAYNLAKSSGLKQPAELMDDPSFIENFVLKNDKVKSQIIKDYILSVKGNNNSPNLISGSSKSVYASPVREKPTTISDASKIVSKMFGLK